ncbi:MAG TPA: hypothetical protein VJ817_11260 [Gemmatimonadales bacterium]|nr:hypothetical protein [Gemmatimonadales bacterium]
MPEPAAQRFGEPAQQGMQDVEIVGVGGEDVGDPILRFHFRREYRPGVDAPAAGPEQTSPRPEDGTQLALGDLGDLTDPLQLVLVEPEEDILGYSGEQLHQVWCEKGRLASSRHQHGPVRSQPSSRPAVQPSCLQPSHPGRRLRYQLIGRRTDREREPEPGGGLPADSLGHVYQRSEEPLGTGQIEKGVAIAAGLDDRRVDPENLVQGARGAGVEAGVGRQQHQIGAELFRLSHQHPPGDARRPGLGRKREHGGPISAGRGHGQRTAHQRRRGHPLDGGDEGWWVDEEDGANHGIQEQRQRSTVNGERELPQTPIPNPNPQLLIRSFFG